MFYSNDELVKMEKERITFLEDMKAIGFPEDLLSNDRITRNFWSFHAANPAVYNELRELALQLLRKGRKRYGIAGLFEVLRWQRALQTTGEEFKLNNNYRALYARLLMYREPELDGFFSVRRRG